jgi:hypothetical protein
VALSTSHNSRKQPRYTFIAVTEIVAGTSQSCIVAKTKKISWRGCYVETPSTLPVGTPLNLVISRDHRSFATKARVIYVHEGSGMGVLFVGPTSDQLQVLDWWLAGLPRSTDAETHRTSF